MIDPGWIAFLGTLLGGIGLKMLENALTEVKAIGTGHNDYDVRCINWHGDRSPARNRTGPWKGSGYEPVEAGHALFGGDTMMLNDHRCLVCAPYTEAEADDLLGWNDEGPSR